MSYSSVSDAGNGLRSDAGPSSLRSMGSSTVTSRTARLMAAYDAKHSNETTAYHEVPSSHFLARPTGQSSGNPVENNAESANAQIPPLPSSPSLRRPHSSEQHASNGQRRASVATENRSETSLSLGEREFVSSVPVHPLFGLSNKVQHNMPTASPSPAVVGGQQQRRPHMPDTTTLAAADYDIDVRSGFLPPEPPVTRLEGIEEDVWETALDRAHAIPLRIGGGGPGVSDGDRIEARRWRRNIRNMLILHPSPQLVGDIRYARRAHLVLSFLAHFYIHSQPEQAAAQEALANKQHGWFQNWRFGKLSQEEQDEVDEATGMYQSIVPASIAVPWVALSRQLDLPPILTYATTVLWNWTLRDPSLGLRDENITIPTTFTGTASEQHFYKTSMLIEKRGVEALTWMRRTLDEAFIADSLSTRRIRHFLLRLARVIEDLSKLLHDVRTDCDPTVFYWGIRPWFSGGDSVVDATTGEKGWIYEGVEEFGGERQLFTGPSAGQSSLIHAIDVFLGVDHSGKATSRSRSSIQQENATFMEKMQTYMPGHHRNFLTHLRNISFVENTSDDWRKQKEIVEQDVMDVDTDDSLDTDCDGISHVETNPLRALLAEKEDCDMHDDEHHHDVVRLRQAYNVSLDALKHLRDEHMRIATLYIITQMRTSPPAAYCKLSDALTTTNRPAKVRKSPASAPDANAVAEHDPDRTDNATGGAKGTGGTDLVSFLKYCRTNTVNALYKSA